jgi:hypothetical protein
VRDVFVLTFDHDETLNHPGLAELAWSDFWARSFSCGGSEAYVGADMIVCATKPFTAGEDAVMTWIAAQDQALLSILVNLADGRDLMLLERLHVKQSRADALAEQQAHLAARLERVRRVAAAVSRIPTQHHTRKGEK